MTRKQRYFLKQRLIGLGVIVLGLLAAVISKEFGGDFCVVLVPMGLVLLLTKKRIITFDSYFWECERRKEMRRRRRS